MANHPPRLLIVLPSWVGDAVMATPALRLIRGHFPGAFIGGLVRPGIDQVLAGLDALDELHVERAAGVMGPKHAAAKVRPRRYDAALLLTNSFSTALITRIAGIPRRVGYARDGRGLLLTDRLEAPKRAGGGWAPIPAVTYYMHAAKCLIEPQSPRRLDAGAPMPLGLKLELAATPGEREAGAAVLASAGIAPGVPLAMLNPGGNNPAKRWPEDRFARTAEWLHARGMTVLINGSPGEAELIGRIAAMAQAPTVRLPAHGITLGALKAILAERLGVVPRCRIMVTNDTGPRHIAAALGVPVVSLFGPTDHRWTTIPTGPEHEAILLADPALPEDLVADDHPQRCSVDKITLESVIQAAAKLLKDAP